MPIYNSKLDQSWASRKFETGSHIFAHWHYKKIMGFVTIDKHLKKTISVFLALSLVLAKICILTRKNPELKSLK